jgi:hypothetical protein
MTAQGRDRPTEVNSDPIRALRLSAGLSHSIPFRNRRPDRVPSPRTITRLLCVMQRPENTRASLDVLYGRQVLRPTSTYRQLETQENRQDFPLSVGTPHTYHHFSLHPQACD